jgi:hypothetical protein
MGDGNRNRELMLFPLKNRIIITRFCEIGKWVTARRRGEAFNPVRDEKDEEKYAIGRIWTGKGLRLVHGPEQIGKDIWWVAITDEALVRTVEGEKTCKKVYESGDTQVVGWVNELHSGKRNLRKHSPVK